MAFIKEIEEAPHYPEAGRILFSCRSTAGEKERFAARGYVISVFIIVLVSVPGTILITLFYVFYIYFHLIQQPPQNQTDTTADMVLYLAGIPIAIILLATIAIISVSIASNIRWPYLAEHGLTLPVKPYSMKSCYIPYDAIISAEVKKGSKDWHTITIEYIAEKDNNRNENNRNKNNRNKSPPGGNKQEKKDEIKQVVFDSFWLGRLESYLTVLKKHTPVSAKIKINCICHANTCHKKYKHKK